MELYLCIILQEIFTAPRDPSENRKSCSSLRRRNRIQETVLAPTLRFCSQENFTPLPNSKHDQPRNRSRSTILERCNSDECTIREYELKVVAVRRGKQ